MSTRVDGIGTTAYTYNPHDGVTLGAGQQTLVNGPFPDDTLKYTYDALGRLSRLQIVDDATQQTASYDEAYTFDARGRVTEVDNNLGLFEYTYAGQSGRPTRVDYPNGMQVLYDYYGATGDHLLKQIQNLSAGPSPFVISQFDYTYKPDRTIDTWTIAQGGPPTTWTFGYDDAQQLTEAVRRDAQGTLLEHERYGYDAAANRTQVVTGTIAPEVRNYLVNNLNQLVAERGFGKTTISGTVDEPSIVTVNGRPARVMSTAGAAPYRFEVELELPVGTSSITVVATDASNNVATQAYEITTTATAGSFAYDLTGNMTADGPASRTYGWDQENRLVSIEAPLSHQWTFEYDGETRRVRMTEKLGAQAQTTEQVLIWCGDRICQKRDALGQSLARNYFEQGFEDGTSPYFYTRDHLGSVSVVAADDGRTITSRRSYGPWGESALVGTGPHSDFGFTGHFQQSSSDAILAPHRTYAQRYGRWLSRDPINEDGGINMHAYVLNAPINLIDPDGLAPRRSNIRHERRPCRADEWAECRAICGSRRVEACAVSVSFKVGGLTPNGSPDYLFFDNYLECACEDPDDNNGGFCENNPVPCGGLLLLIGACLMFGSGGGAAVAGAGAAAGAF